MKVIKIYTDGSYKSSKGMGAIAFVILKESEIIIEFSKTFKSTEKNIITNNKMEMISVIKSLDWLRSNGYSPKTYRIYLYTDSQYIQLGLTEWLKKWKAKNWKNSSGKEIKHKDLWVKLDNLIQTEFKSLHVHWIEGHTGNKYNERADELCHVSMKDFVDSKINVNGNTNKNI